MVAGDDLNSSTENGAAEFLDSNLRSLDGAWSLDIREWAREVRQNTDPDRIGSTCGTYSGKQ